jgi:hypothetical protein
MISPIANLFLSLQYTISNLADGSGNNYFKFVDQELGQLDNQKPGSQPPVLFPCVLIDIDDLHYKSIATNSQMATGKVILRLGFPPYSAGSAATPAEYKQKSLYYYELEQILHLTLQGQPPILLDDSETDILVNIFGKFNRLSAKTEHRKDTLRVREITYEIAYDDYSTEPGKQTLPAALYLTEELELPL